MVLRRTAVVAERRAGGFESAFVVRGREGVGLLGDR